MFNFSKFFLEKMDLVEKKNVDIFEKLIDLQIRWIVFKNETWKMKRPAGGAW